MVQKVSNENIANMFTTCLNDTDIIVISTYLTVYNIFNTFKEDWNVWEVYILTFYTTLFILNANHT